MFATLSDRLAETFKNLRGKGRLSEADIDATAREIRIALLEADVALPVVREFVDAVKERARGEEVSQALNPAQQVVKIVNDELVDDPRRRDPPAALRQDRADRDHAGRPPGRRQDHARRQARAAGSRSRASSRCSSRPTSSAPTPSTSSRSTASAPAYRSSRPSPATASATRCRSRATRSTRPGASCYDVVIVDTAGRLGVDAEMMQQAADIRDAVSPDEILFVVDAMIGQDAVTTAQAFLDGVGYDGVVLTKLDGDARGGAALSIRGVTGKPVMFASAGEKLTDFDVFHPDRMASRILDMGDVMTLIEQAEKTFDQEQALKAADKLTGQGGEFTLDDFLEQMQQVRKLGSMSKIMGMLPGMGQFRDQLENFDEREIDRIQAIIQSMTPAERANPKIIDGSRRARIAKGSGRQVSDVNSLVDRFFEARKMMMSFAKGGGMPGLPGMPGHVLRRQARPGQAGRQEQAGQGAPRQRQPREGRPAGQGRRGEGRGAAATRSATPTARRSTTRRPRRRSTCRRTSPSSSSDLVARDRSWSSTAPTSWARGPTAGGRTAPARPGASTSS